MIKLTQLTTRILSKPLLVLLGVRIIGNVKPNSRSIIASNHVSMLDFLLVGSTVKLLDLINDSRIYTMTSNKYLNWPIVGLWLKMNGGFYAKNPGKKKALYGINGSVSILKRGHNILLFPQGGISTNGAPREPKTGIEVIARKTNASITPVYIHKARRFGIPTFTVVSGAPMEYSGQTKEKIMEEIYKLSHDVLNIRK